MSTAVTTKPSIGSLVRTALEASDNPDAFSVVDLVLDMISPDDYRLYMRELLMTRVSTEVGMLRRSVTPPIVRATSKETPKRKGVSTYAALVRDEFWPKFLHQRISVEGGHKFLADASADDLRYVAQVRRDQANDLTYRADQFDTLADLMVKSNASRLADLDAHAGSEVMGQAA